MTIADLEQTKVVSVEQGKALAASILETQLALHEQLKHAADNVEWQLLSDQHFYLRKVRLRILHETGLLAMKRKRALNA